MATRILTLAQTGRRLKLSTRTIRDLAKLGKIRGASKIDHSWRFDEQQLLSMFSGGGGDAASESNPQEAA